MVTKKHKLQSPIVAREKVESFINSSVDTGRDTKIVSDKAQPVNITLNKRDLSILEDQIDRATKLGLRTKTRSSLIRMSLRALAKASDELYITLYKE